MDYEATTVWALKNPDGHTVQRFSIHKSDNDHVWFYVRKAQRSRQRIKRTSVTIETQGRDPKRTTVYEDVYEEEW